MPLAWPASSARLESPKANKTFFFQDAEGQMRHTHSVAAGLDYIGVSPILAHLAEIGRVRIGSCDRPRSDRSPQANDAQ